MTSCSRLNSRWKQIEFLQNLVKIDGIFLYNFHRLQFFQSGLFDESVIINIAIVCQMSGICDISDISDFIIQKSKTSVNKIERQKSSHISQMYIAVNRRSTNVHPD